MGWLRVAWSGGLSAHVNLGCGSALWVREGSGLYLRWFRVGSDGSLGGWCVYSWTGFGRFRVGLGLASGRTHRDKSSADQTLGKRPSS